MQKAAHCWQLIWRFCLSFASCCLGWSAGYFTQVQLGKWDSCKLNVMRNDFCSVLIGCIQVMMVCLDLITQIKVDDTVSMLCASQWCRVDDVACADPELCKQICGNPVGCTDTAYARLVMELLPAGEVSCLLYVQRTRLRASISCHSLCVPSKAWEVWWWQLWSLPSCLLWPPSLTAPAHFSPWMFGRFWDPAPPSGSWW